MVGQDLIQILFNVPGAAFQHHVQVPGACHAVGGVVGVHPHLVQDGVHPALRNEHVAGLDGPVPIPPAAQGKGLGGFMAVHVEGEGELGPQLRLNAQQLQHLGVGGRLVGALLGQGTLHRIAEGPVGVVCVGPAHLHMGLVEGHLCGHAQEAPHPPLVDEGIILQFAALLLRQVLETAVGKAPHLAEVGLLDALVDGQGDSKEGGEQHRRQGDGQHRNEVSGPVGF